MYLLKLGRGSEQTANTRIDVPAIVIFVASITELSRSNKSRKSWSNFLDIVVPSHLKTESAAGVFARSKTESQDVGTVVCSRITEHTAFAISTARPALHFVETISFASRSPVTRRYANFEQFETLHRSDLSIRRSADLLTFNSRDLFPVLSFPIAERSSEEAFSDDERRDHSNGMNVHEAVSRIDITLEYGSSSNIRYVDVVVAAKLNHRGKRDTVFRDGYSTGEKRKGQASSVREA